MGLASGFAISEVGSFFLALSFLFFYSSFSLVFVVLWVFSVRWRCWDWLLVPREEIENSTENWVLPPFVFFCMVYKGKGGESAITGIWFLCEEDVGDGYGSSEKCTWVVMMNS